ncbi:hypothetical protein PpBr36_01859 [Pyricularia pennisetigena]|uniref:hypothetical protein n=1 Tax=Pyricularia pennisetigena TaxID=1578925 RepID=UPI0011520D8A|nr:hypothetical protein PpBr36_01859 [Pyricularia pennisetigena]TLS29843.1 hypothetical protein PpBr36_01859 [Pyricularia pennisetigena]
MHYVKDAAGQEELQPMKRPIPPMRKDFYALHEEVGGSVLVVVASSALLLRMRDCSHAALRCTALRCPALPCTLLLEPPSPTIKAKQAWEARRKLLGPLRDGNQSHLRDG